MKRSSGFRACERASLGRLPWKAWIRPGFMACALICLPGCARKTITSAPPPPPSHALVQRVTRARNVFLSNAGANDYFNGQISGAPNVIYNELYASLRQWGYFQLVDSPDQADLIFQVRGTEAAPEIIMDPFGQSRGRQHQPHLQLTILDPSKDPAQPATLDTIVTPAGRGENIPQGKIAFAKSIEWLTYKISTLVSTPPARSSGLNPSTALRPSFETLLNFQAPIPPQFLNARRVYLEADQPRKNGGLTLAPDLKDFQSALSKWGYYHLVSSPQEADVVFHLRNDPDNGVSLTVTPPNSRVILWTIDDPRWGFTNSGAKVDRNLVSLLKQIHHIPLSRQEMTDLR
ncbi:MAG: hypothetical protein ACP5E5_00475 [Acidobacteriaceae bacterium]